LGGPTLWQEIDKFQVVGPGDFLWARGALYSFVS
jgi:hypothetical protein